MRIRHLALAAFFSLAGFASPIALGAAMAESEIRPAEAITVEELMRATALDDIFSQFGPSIEASLDEPQMQAQLTKNLRSVWADSVREVFVSSEMHAALAKALEGHFTEAENAEFARFFHSDFGREVTTIERAAASLSPEGQMAAREEGIRLAGADDPRRQEQITEMLELVSAEIANVMVYQSVRGMLIGMSVSTQSGDIQVPWEEIDAHLEALMPNISADIALTQRAMMFYAYRDLGEDDLEHYLEFMRTPAARKFYAIAIYSVGQIVTDRMSRFGETLAHKLARVSV